MRDNILYLLGFYGKGESKLPGSRLQDNLVFDSCSHGISLRMEGRLLIVRK